MRKIKFRGKWIDYQNRWVYGNLILVNNKPYINHATCVVKIGDSSIVTSASEVDVSTVGQFTGLLDRNDKEIYEGDIVQVDYITTIGKHCIGLSFEVKWCTQEGCWVGWDGFVENPLQQTRKMFVVKGNIYDNPELLKGGVK